MQSIVSYTPAPTPTQISLHTHITFSWESLSDALLKEHVLDLHNSVRDHCTAMESHV